MIKKASKSLPYKGKNYNAVRHFIELPDGIFDLSKIPSDKINPNWITRGGVKELYLPDDYTGNATFSSLALLEKIQGIEKYETIPNMCFMNCQHLVIDKLSDSLTSIGTYAFSTIAEFNVERLPQTLTSIGGSAFLGVSKLGLKYIPSGITTINNNTFSKLSGDVELNFEGDITSIGSGAFAGASSTAMPDRLKVTFLSNTSIPTLGANAFANLPEGYVIVVPDSLYDSWIADSSWSSISYHIIKESQMEVSDNA